MIGLSALQLSKLIGVRTAHALRAVMGEQYSHYRLNELVEIDNAYIDANKTAKAGRGCVPTRLFVTIENSEQGKPGFIAVEVLNPLGKVQTIDFANQLNRLGSSG
jgi:hypothetical protein